MSSTTVISNIYKQTVCVNGVFSSQQTIQCGVPQGSILGPWCYLIFCNDMPSCVKCKMILYTDDTILLDSHTNLDKLSAILSKELAHCIQELRNRARLPIILPEME